MSNYKFETIQLHAGQEAPDIATDARAVPIYATTSYVFKDSAQAAGRFALSEDGNIYTRLMNPTSNVFEKRIAALENGAAALSVATDSAAITYVIQNIASAGEHIVSSSNLYGVTHNLFADTLRKQGISTTFVSPDNIENFEKAILPNTKLIYAEAFGNPNSAVIDLRAIIAYIVKMRTTLLREQGATISPFNSFLLLQGLETLSLRVERHVKNALKVVDFLKNHPQVERVNHPSLADGREKELYDEYFPNAAASISTFEIKGSADDAKKFTESLKLFSLLANVADVKSLVIHPASTTHSRLDEKELAASGITPTTVRLSIGTEHIDDIISDLTDGFEAIK